MKTPFRESVDGIAATPKGRWRFVFGAMRPTHTWELHHLPFRLYTELWDGQRFTKSFIQNYKAILGMGFSLTWWYNLYQSLPGLPWRLLPALRCLRLQAGDEMEGKGRPEIWTLPWKWTNVPPKCTNFIFQPLIIKMFAFLGSNQAILAILIEEWFLGERF